MVLRGGEAGTLGMPIFLTDADVDSIAQAYVVAAHGGHLYRSEFPHPMDPQIKVRLTVPGHPNIKERCLRAELMLNGEIRDWHCFKHGFDDPVAILEVPNTVRVMVQLDTSRVKGAIPKLPYPTYD